MDKTTSFLGRQTAFQLLGRILQGGAYSNVLIRNLSQNSEITDGDRAMAVQLTYGVLRNMTLLDEVLRAKSRRQQLSISPTALILGRMALYEILFMESVPIYASVSEYVELVHKHATPGEASFLNACLRHSSPDDIKRVLDSMPDLEGRLGMKYSQPKWFVQVIRDSYNEKICEEVLDANNTPSSVFVRVNARRIGQSEWIKEWKKTKCKSAAPPPACVDVTNQFPTDAYLIGQVSPQDRSTQLVGYFVSPKAGEKILDLCCGSGSKTSQLVELGGDEVKVTALDLYEAKIEELKKEFKRLIIPKPETVVADLQTKPDLGKFNKVLVDVPCTGTATFRRRPEIRYRIRFTDLDKIIMLQDALLDAAGSYVAPGGKLFYVTCSLLPMENEAVVRRFLAAHPKFSEAEPPADAKKMATALKAVYRQGGLTFLPQYTNGNGIFISCMQRAK